MKGSFKCTAIFVFGVFLLLTWSNAVYATHNRAGEITYTLLSPLSYQVNVITYTKSSSSDADRDSIVIDWGDGSLEQLPRVNGPDISPLNGVPDGEDLASDIKKNVYTGIHVYAGPRPFYVISVTDPNRIDLIVNISDGNSVFVPFYIEDSLRFLDIASLGLNSSPVLLNPPIDFANVGDTFYHNPNAWDAEGDSLYFTFVNPKQAMGLSVPAYVMPDQIIPGPDNNFTINNFTGEIEWAVPQKVGIYNIAILINEFRNGLNLGNIIRDMEIIVEDNPNNPPQIAEMRDTCVVAGDVLRLAVSATDPELSQLVTLSAEGGPFQVVTNPASFPIAVGNPVSSDFEWITVCEHIRSQDYQVVFKAEDNFINSALDERHLVDLESWLIKVIAPAPENLQAEASGNSIRLNWDSLYKCSSFENFRGFSIWRRVNSNPFIPSYCETGLEGRGYAMIASEVLDYRYTDMDVSRGNTYCYRILAHFSKLSPNGLFESDISVSIPSNEDCAELKRDVPIIINVDVDSTDFENGQIYVKWIGPLADSVFGLDTLADPPPYRYELSRKEGFVSSAEPYESIHSFTANTFAELANDSAFWDSGLNTKEKSYTYQLRFSSNGGADSVGSSSPSSSVFLGIAPFDQSLLLKWSYTTSWLNDSFSIFKQDKISLLFDSLDITERLSYLDTGLINDSQYCYYTESWGHYTNGLIPKPLRNRSQIHCDFPRDTVAPCPPELNVISACEFLTESWTILDLKNRLFWNPLPDSCASDLHKVAIYFKPAGSEKFSLIDTTAGKSDTDFLHLCATLPSGVAGCYRVTAFDRAGNESSFSNEVCVENCPLYELPNTFTPNNDGQNDIFTPILPFRFVSRVELSIFDKWGVKVFETTDPFINWNGTDQKNSKDCSEGVYYYGGHYYVPMLGGEQQFPLPGGKKGGGFIHLIRNKL